VNIFLSYGHDDYASLAVRIKRSLEALGHEVWFDVDRLKARGDWERYVEDGLDFASAVPDAGRFLLLLTPHSVRRPRGYCLNELARAYGRNLPVIPVMVSTVEPPLSICRLQWLDMRHCFPAEQHEEQYNKKFAELVKALEEKQVPFEGIQQRLLGHLRPIAYDDDLTRHLERFTGREWVMTEVQQWLASRRRMLWITGEAGVGKSALAAWLCDKRPEITAYHFCRFGNSESGGLSQGPHVARLPVEHPASGLSGPTERIPVGPDRARNQPARAVRSIICQPADGPRSPQRKSACAAY
jgi:hypothetical protein